MSALTVIGFFLSSHNLFDITSLIPVVGLPLKQVNLAFHGCVARPESVKTVEEAGGEVFFELKKEIKKGGEDSGVERPLLIMMGFKTGVASQDPVLAGRLERIMVKVNYRGPF